MRKLTGLLGSVFVVVVFVGVAHFGAGNAASSTVAFCSDRDGDPEIYLMNPDGSNLQRVTDNTSNEHGIACSPDGRWIAFVSDRAGNPQIHVMEVETGRTRRLTDLNWCDSPAWSPNGEWIAFAGRISPKSRLNIYLVDLTASQLRQLTRYSGDNENPVWSPDGRYLAFTTTRSGRREIYVMDADGSAPHRLIDVPGNSYTPSWSR